MRSHRSLILIGVVLMALSHQSDAQQVRPVGEQLRLAGVMPRGAMVYLQARDLSALMKQWLASPLRDQFYKSASYSAFSNSHIYLKLQSRKQDIETAIGFGLDENRLAELAGGGSAVAIYDIGNLELVFVTELPRERAIATVLFKQAPKFQERSSSEGVYYVREVTTDGGRLNQQFCFAFTGGRMIVTTTEGLMIRALANATTGGRDSVLADVTAAAERARGFAAHEMTMWLDQAKLNRNRHFNSYWIHDAAGKDDQTSLSNIETGLIDLRITARGLAEQRWFTLKTEAGGRPAKGAQLSGAQASALLRFAPADTQLIRLRAQPADPASLVAAVSNTLFGRLPDGSGAPPRISDDAHSEGSEEGGPTHEGRYSHLDNRFDVDVDDEQAPGIGERREGTGDGRRAQSAAGRGSQFSESVLSIISGAAPSGYCELARSKAETGKPFVRFERAVVIAIGSAPDRAALEGAITNELRSRFVVAGVEPQLNWQEEAGVRYVAQSLLEQGAAYSVTGKHLVLASSRAFARDIVTASAAAAAPAPIQGPVGYYAIVRVARARAVFDTLMAKLDGKTSVGSEKTDQEGEESGQDVKFFSGNLSSLVAASAVREVRVTRDVDGAALTERLFYSW